MYEAGTHITDQGALATLSGAKTGRSPRDKRVVREADSEKDIWWNQEGNGSPNYECDERWAVSQAPADSLEAHPVLNAAQLSVGCLSGLAALSGGDASACWRQP